MLAPGTRLAQTGHCEQSAGDGQQPAGPAGTGPYPGT